MIYMLQLFVSIFFKEKEIICYVVTLEYLGGSYD